MIKVLIVEDHASMRESLAAALTAAGDFSVVGEVPNADYALDFCRHLYPDLVLMDVCTEGGASGLKAVEAIRKADSVSGVVIDAKGQYVWERGNRYLVYDLSTSQASAVSELQNALASGTSALEAVDNMSDQKVLELTGCTVEEMLYLINKDTPVIGVRNGASAIILTGYDESHVTYVDSENGESKTVTQEEMDQIMQSSGNAYVGYLKKAEE